MKEEFVVNIIGPSGRPFNIVELAADLRFLFERAMKAGKYSSSADRDTGQSANSIVNIAYNFLSLISTEQILPSDQSDLDACLRMFQKLPDHRKTAQVFEAMRAAETAIHKKGDES